MEKQFQVTKCEIKKQGTNEKTGKDWILYRITCSGDNEMKEFTTFNPDYQNSEGQQMRGIFEYNEKFKNWQEISTTQEKENEKHNEVMNALKFIAEQNKVVIKKLEDIDNFFINKDGKDKPNNTTEKEQLNRGGAEEGEATGSGVPRL